VLPLPAEAEILGESITLGIATVEVAFEVATVENAGNDPNFVHVTLGSASDETQAILATNLRNAQRDATND
jgi:hypothetical protein